MKILHDIKMPLSATEEDVKNRCAKLLNLSPKRIRTFKILRRSLDARNKDRICYVYSVGISKEVEIEPEKIIPKASADYRPIVVGFGPAGMICAHVLAKAGLNPIVLERGESVNERKTTVEKFRESGELNVESNAQFGEGGAGAFSDGKLTTGIGEKDKADYILKLFVSHGVDKNILTDAKPHIGTDKLLPMVESIRREIESLGGEVRFSEKVIDVKKKGSLVNVITTAAEYETDSLVLAIGHSARDTYKMLYANGFDMEPKAFSMGFRVEHLQREINRAMYGDSFENPALPPAEYKCKAHSERRRLHLLYVSRRLRNGDVERKRRYRNERYELFRSRRTKCEFCGFDYGRRGKRRFRRRRKTVALRKTCFYSRRRQL